MKFKVDIEVNIEAIYDTETEEFEVIHCKPKITKKANIESSKWIKHKMTKTQVNFGILTLGAKTLVGTQLPQGQQIKVLLLENDKIIDEKTIVTHKTVRGRIDGLTSFYTAHKEIGIDTVLEVRYLSDEYTLEIQMCQE